jgi:DNA replication initiation complex subunit (GINS family)
MLTIAMLSSFFFTSAAAQDTNNDSNQPTSDPTTLPEHTVKPSDPQNENSQIDTSPQPDAVLYTIQDNSTETDQNEAEDANLFSIQTTPDNSLVFVTIAILLAIITISAISVVYNRKKV